MPDEIVPAKQDSPQVTPSGGANAGPTSEKGAESTSKETPKTYSESEYQKAVSDALAKAGREHKKEVEAIARERDSFKSASEANTAKLTETQDQIKNLEERLDDLTQDDPDKSKLLKELRKLEQNEKTLKEREASLKESETTHAERLTKAERIERETNCAEIAGAYEGGDAARLKRAAEKLNLTTKGQIDDLAATFWTKKEAKKEETAEGETIQPDSGATNGGAGDAEFLKGFAQGKYGSPEDFKRAEQIMARKRSGG